MLGALKPKLRDGLTDALFTAGLTRPGRDPRWLTIVTFHRVLPAEQLERYPVREIGVTPEELAWFLDALKAEYDCGPVSEIHARWCAERRPRRPLAAISFDDGQLDNFEHARPVLAAAGVRASFFLPIQAMDEGSALWHDRVGFALQALLQDAPELGRARLDAIGVPSTESGRAAILTALERAKLRPDAERRVWVESVEAALGRPARPSWDGMMSWDQARQLQDEGHELGSHSWTHAILPRVDDAGLEREIAGSRAALYERLGRWPETFCYPNGDADARVVRQVRRAGYRQAVTTRYGPNRRGAAPLELKRCDLRGDHARNADGVMDARRLAWRLSPIFPGA